MHRYKKWHGDSVEPERVSEPEYHFPTDYAAVMERIMKIDPVKYAKTRNFINGSVTYLSPYISRGFISTRQVFESLQSRGFRFYEVEKMVSELVWRDYFQRVWQSKGDLLWTDLRQTQPDIMHYKLPVALQEAGTGIEAIDSAIKRLMAQGYMHNHVRMYTASIACNIGGAHWLAPAKWMYYHLLDGDPASNHLSWQWVAAAFSGKKYYCNQENINKYTGSRQRNTFLDTDYGSLPPTSIPPTLSPTCEPNLITPLPKTPLPLIDTTKPVLLYNSFNLDPQWHADYAANRILLLEPSHFTKYPVGKKVLEFIITLAIENIPGIQVFAGEVNEIPSLREVPAIYHKEHPAFLHYPGNRESRDWLAPEVSGYFPSFFAYWKKAERHLKW